MAVPISIEDHVRSCYAPPLRTSSSSQLITHFYVKKLEEEQVMEVERTAASTATDHGLEVMYVHGCFFFIFTQSHAPFLLSLLQVLGMVRVPLYTLKAGGGLPLFLSHSFIGNARSQLIETVLGFKMIAPKELHKALAQALERHPHTAEDLKAALAYTEKQF